MDKRYDNIHRSILSIRGGNHLLPVERKSMNIEINESHFRMLEELCKNFYVVPGQTPKDPGKAIEMMIDREYNRYSPPVYQTSGFDRQ